MPPKWWDQIMSRVIAVVACGFTACRMLCIDAEPEFSQLIAAERGIAVRIRAAGRGGQDLVGQTCRTPCELTVQVAASSRRRLRSTAISPRRFRCVQKPALGIRLPAACPEPGLRRACAPLRPHRRRRSRGPRRNRLPTAAPFEFARGIGSTFCTAAHVGCSTDLFAGARAAASATNYPWPARAPPSDKASRGLSIPG